MKNRVRLTNGETIEHVLEVQFSADGGILQIDVTDHAIRFGIQGLLSFFNGRIEHIYVWHLSNGQLCHTKVYGAETSLFENQLAEIEKELTIAHAPFDATSSTFELTDDKRHGHEPKYSDWYNAVDLTSE